MKNFIQEHKILLNKFIRTNVINKDSDKYFYTYTTLDENGIKQNGEVGLLMSYQATL